MGWIDLDIEILSGEESIANGYFQAKGDTFCTLYFTTQIVKFFFEMHNNMNMFQKAVLLLQMIGAGIDNEEAKLIFTQQFADPFGFSSIDKFTQQETFPPRISDKNELTINGEERLPILQYAGALFFPCLSKKKLDVVDYRDREATNTSDSCNFCENRPFTREDRFPCL